MAHFDSTRAFTSAGVCRVSWVIRGEGYLVVSAAVLHELHDAGPVAHPLPQVDGQVLAVNLAVDRL